MGAHYVSDWKNLKKKMVIGCTLLIIQQTRWKIGLVWSYLSTLIQSGFDSELYRKFEGILM